MVITNDTQSYPLVDSTDYIPFNTEVILFDTMAQEYRFPNTTTNGDTPLPLLGIQVGMCDI